jgi:hypothetical protein
LFFNLPSTTWGLGPAAAAAIAVGHPQSFTLPFLVILCCLPWSHSRTAPISFKVRLVTKLNEEDFSIKPYLPLPGCSSPGSAAQNDNNVITIHPRMFFQISPSLEGIQGARL